MAKGKACTVYLGREGLVQAMDMPDYNFLYDPATSVKDSRWNIGDRCVLPDGRVFRYAKSSGACYTYRFCMFDGAIAVSYTAALQAQAIGDTSIHIDAGAAAAVAADELRGGYVIIYGSDDSNTQFRGIIGNTLADSDGHTTIYLDAPLTVAITTNGVEVCPNPYRAVSLTNTAGSSTYRSAAGVPAVESDASGEYLWIQTWGPCAVAPGESAVCDAAFERSVCVDPSSDAGGTHEGYDATFGIPVSGQIVGFGLERSSSGNGVVFINITINP